VPKVSSLPTKEAPAQRKLDLGYFTEPDRCPLMVRRGARSAFELFLYLAQHFLERSDEPVLANHKAMCHACGLDPDRPHSRSSVSRLLRSLRRTFQVIDYEPLQRRRPQVRLAPARPNADILNPRHYVYFDNRWDRHCRAVFEALGSRAFSTEYMYWIAKYESALARTKHKRDYWFFPLERISATYHISAQFAGMGLRGLVDLGIMRVTHGQYGLRAPNNEFGAANRYHFEGLGEVQRRQRAFAELEDKYATIFDLAKSLAAVLANGQTVKNVEGLCELITTHGEAKVRQAIGQVAALPPRSLRRRLAYIAALARDDGTARCG
jgi:hypothetical protein